MKILIFAGLFQLLSLSSFAQDIKDVQNNPQDPEIISIPNNQVFHILGPTIGYRGFQDHLMEFGFAYASGNHGFIGVEGGFMSNFKTGEDRIHGYSLGYYKGFAIFETGISATLYTNYENSQFSVKPFFGLGVGGIAVISYGLNISIRNDDFKTNRLHEIRFIFRLPIDID